MRRVQIYLDEDVDDSLAVEAARRGISKAALIRKRLGENLADSEAASEAREAIVGWIDDPLPGADSIDDVVYGS
jgi:hypothetical protein